MQDRFDLAESDFQQASRLSPEKNFGTVGMGVTYLETGNASKAIDLLHQQLKQNPNDASLLYLLGEALMRNGARAEEKDAADAAAESAQARHERWPLTRKPTSLSITSFALLRLWCGLGREGAVLDRCVAILLRRAGWIRRFGIRARGAGRGSRGARTPRGRGAST